MRDTESHARLRGIARRSVRVGRAMDAREYARSVADAAEGDARMGGCGVAVSVEITTDPAEAPADCTTGETL